VTLNQDWAGKIAVVTGGSSGIGEATVAGFVSRSAKVVILDRLVPTTSNATFIRCDVSSDREIEAAANQILSELGNVSFLVNSAGIQRYGTRRNNIRGNLG
jgi:NAD(P)-dependent dehydrogenase (short-subunit alcohol dehydrogenase family)